MDIQELFNKTQEHHISGRFTEAISGYEQLLGMEPDNAQICYLQGMLYFERHDLDQAERWFKKTVTIAPQAASAHYNLGVIAFEKGHFEEAIGCYETAASLMPQDTDTLFNLALTLKRTHRLQEAEEIYIKVLSLAPQESDIPYNLGVLNKDMGNHNEAIRYFEQTLELQPNHMQALNNLGYLYHRQQHIPAAIDTYKRLISANYNRSAAHHMLAALTGKSTDRAPAEYVRDVFDQFSDHYEESLIKKLEYHTPVMLREMLERNQPNPSFKLGLDMGCGTGLSGEALHDLCPILIGIDLSAKMLAKAQEKDIYHELHESDITAFLTQQQGPIDLFIAADVFVYIGDLQTIFTLVTNRASPNGIFLFSTEHCDTNTFQLKDSGRYGHSKKYIEKRAKEHNFKIIESQEAQIRKERGEWIAGNLYMLQKLS